MILLWLSQSLNNDFLIDIQNQLLLEILLLIYLILAGFQRAKWTPVMDVYIVNKIKRFPIKIIK